MSRNSFSLKRLQFPTPFKRRYPPVQNVNDIFQEQLTIGQRTADSVARVVGSWTFIIIQSVFFFFWIVLNVAGWVYQWDPYPFILMNLVLSLQAAYAAPIIMKGRSSSMLTLTVPAWDITVRTIAVYLFILLGLRLTGKREIGQMAVFDLVLLLLIANSVQNAMLGPDSSLLGGLIAATVLLIMNTGVARLRLRSTRLRRLIEGSPTVLVLHGEVMADQLRREGIDEDTLAAVIREHGVAELSKVEMAVLEVDGSISVVPVGQPTKRIKRAMKVLRPQ